MRNQRMSNWQAAEEGDLQDDLESEFELSNNAIEKECILFAVDCSPEMFQANHHLGQIGSSITAFQAAMKCISSVIKNKIICAESDRIGVVCYNTSKSKNTAGFPHILQLLDIDVPDAPSILEIEKFSRRPEAFKDVYGSSEQEFPFGNVFWTVANIFSDKKFVGFQKRIFLFTCEDHPNASSESLQKAAKTRGKDLIDLGIELDLFAIPKDSSSSFNYSNFYSHILPELSSASAAADSENDGEHLGKLEELLIRVRRKESRKRALARTQLSLGPSMNLSVRIFSLFMETRKGQYVWMNERTGQVMTPKTEWICKETRKPLEPTQFKFSFDYGGEKIVFSKEEIKNMYKFEEDIGLKILGFKPKSALKNSHNITHSSFVYPDESIGGSITVFSSLLKNCLELNKMVVCRWTPWRGAPPRLVALLPQAEKLDEIRTQIKAPGFNMIILPFADDIRHLRFDDDEEAAAISAANHDQIDKAKALINRLVVPSADVSFDNPVLQKHYANLQALALDQEIEDDVVDSSVPDYEKMKVKAEEQIIAFKDSIGLQNLTFDSSESAVKGTRKRSNSNDQDGIASIAEVRNDPVALSRFSVNELKAYLESIGIKPKRLKGEIVQQISETAN